MSSSSSGWRERLSQWPEKLGSWQYRRAGAITAACFALGFACLPLILKLRLNSDFTALLPQSSQSVRDLDEIQQRFGGQMPVMMTVEARDADALHRYVRELVPRIERRRDLQVVAVDYNVSEFEAFVTEHRHLYARLDDLREIRDALRARLDWERSQLFDLGLDDEPEPPPDPQATIDRIERESREAQEEMHRRYPDGFFQHDSRPLVLVIVHTRIRGAAVDDVNRLETGLRHEAASVANPPAGLAIHYGGNPMEVREETLNLQSAMLDSLLLTLGLVSLSILIFFLRMRPVPLLVLVLVPPVMITFGFAQLTVTYLNASSAFLTSIVVGNGVNSSIIWLARYFEERKANVPLEKALQIAHRGTWKGTLTAAMAAAVSYGALVSTDYRGFRDFGIIGGVGMVLCWLATLFLLPALAVLFERVRPLKFGPRSQRSGIYGVIFARLALRAPRFVTAGSVLVTLVMGGAVAWAIAENPLEYDYGRMRSMQNPHGDVVYVQHACRGIREVSETATGGAMAVLAPRHADVALYRTQLERYRRTHSHDFGLLRSIDDLLPSDQREKIAVLADLRALMLEARPRLEEDQQHLIDEQLPPADVRPLGPNDLPISVARGFTESDGTRGRLLFVEHNPDESVYDGRYMIRWAAAARSIRSPGATEPPPVAGTGVVFADLLSTVWSEAPRAIAVALLATIFLVVLTFRTSRERWLTVGALMVGVLWMSGALWLLGMKLNFLNIIAYPIAFGTGVDYAVNVMRRYADDKQQVEGRKAIRAAVEETGGAVTLCSMTTLIGYFSLHTSTNQALRSFGTAMATAEITCLLVAVLALPALVYWLDAPRRAAASAAEGSGDVRPSEV